MEELIILNSDDREKLKGYIMDLIFADDANAEFEAIWNIEELLFTEEERQDITDRCVHEYMVGR